MKHFNPLRDKLREESDLPDFLSWDEVGDDILKRVDKPRNNRRLIWFFVFIGVATAAFTFRSMFSPKEKSQNAKFVEDLHSPGSLDQKLEKTLEETFIVHNDIEDKEIISPKTKIDHQNKAEFIKELSHNSDQKAVSDGLPPISADDRSSKNQKIKNTEDGLTKTRTTDKIDSEFLVEMEVDAKEGISKRELFIDSNGDRSKISSGMRNGTNEAFKEQISHLPAIALNIKHKPRNFELNPIIQEENKPSVPSYEKKLLFSVGYGSNVRNSGYGSSELGKERSIDESILPGHSASLAVNYLMTKHFSLSSGLDFDQFSFRLDKTISTSAIEEQKDVLVGYLISPISMNRASIIADTSIVVETKRTLRHYNSISQVSIPVTFTARKNFKNVQLYAGLGAKFSWIAAAKGRTTRGSEVIDFGSNNRIHRQILLGAGAEIGLNYFINDRVFAGFNIRGDKALSNVSSEDGITSKPQTASGQVRIGYKF